MKILIIKLSAIGDVVMATGMTNFIRKQYPDVSITWLCGKSVEPLLKITNSADEIIALDEKRLLTGGLFSKLFVLIGVWLKLFGRRYDLVCLGHSDSRFRILTVTLFAKQLRRFTYKFRQIPLPGRYHGDEYLRLVVGADDYNLPLTELPKPDLQLPESLNVLLDHKRKKIILAPGGAKNVMREDLLRRWSIENYVLLAQRLIADGRQVIVTGAPSDAWVSASFVGLDIVDIVGQTNLEQFVALCSSVDLVITHDSGPLHLAKLSYTPIIGLFGPVDPAGRVGKLENVHVIWGGEKLACRPCYDGKDFAACDKNLCMQSITVDRVYNLATKIII